LNQGLGFADEDIRNSNGQFRLGPEIVEHVALRHPGGAGDIGNAGCGEPVDPEQPRRCCHDRFTPLIALFRHSSLPF
jgi:hypothetical protein